MNRDFSGGPVVKTPMQRVRVQSLVGELRSHMPCCMAKKKNKHIKRNLKIKSMDICTWATELLCGTPKTNTAL